jgi:hypothetical protein
LLGIYLGIFYLRGVRPERVLLGAHILLGLGGVEQLALLIHGAPSGAMTSESFSKAAAGLFALSIFSGFTAPQLPNRGDAKTERSCSVLTLDWGVPVSCSFWRAFQICNASGFPLGAL